MVLVGLVMRAFHSMHASDIRHSRGDSSSQHRSIGRPTWQEARREYEDACSGIDPSMASICVPQVEGHDSKDPRPIFPPTLMANPVNTIHQTHKGLKTNLPFA